MAPHAWAPDPPIGTTNGCYGEMESLTTPLSSRENPAKMNSIGASQIKSEQLLSVAGPVRDSRTDRARGWGGEAGAGPGAAGGARGSERASEREGAGGRTRADRGVAHFALVVGLEGWHGKRRHVWAALVQLRRAR
jgi:hypothetical protein